MILEKISPEMFEAALNNLPECIAILDGQGRIWWLNRAGIEKLPPVGSFCFAELSQVKECLENRTDIKNARVGITVRGVKVSGLLNVGVIDHDGAFGGILAVFRPDYIEPSSKNVYSSAELPFRSESMLNLREKLAKMAILNSTILFTGERGSGKEMFARFLHRNSTRSSEPIEVIECRDADEQTFACELMGIKDSPGKVELAGTGTLLIKNIETLPNKLQVKIFDILRTKRVTYYDDSRSVSVEARILLSTSSDLSAAVKAGKFREDLYLRISVMSVNIPPLREHVEDIPPLAWYFAQKYAALAKKEITGFTSGAVEHLCSHMWPRNLRQLEDTMCAAVDLCEGTLITEKCIPKEIDVLPSLGKMTAGFEKERVMSLLKLYGNSVEGKKKAAAELNIGLSTLYRILGRRG